MLEEINPLRRRNILSKAIQFGKENKNLLIIVCDPKSDDLVAVYNNHYSAATINKNYLFGLVKRKCGIVKSIIYRKKDRPEDEKNITRFLEFIDAFLFNLSRELNQGREGQATEIKK